MEIWRTTPGRLGYSRIALVNLSTYPSGVYYDKKLTNGAKYSYYLVARGEERLENGPDRGLFRNPQGRPSAAQRMGQDQPGSDADRFAQGETAPGHLRRCHECEDFPESRPERRRSGSPSARR